MALGFPYSFDRSGRTSTAGGDDGVRQLLEQLLFTGQGERVNRPDFGTNLLQLLFAPNSDQLATATQLLVQGNLQRWLGDKVVVEAVEARAEEAALVIAVRYWVLPAGQPALAEFRREVRP